MFFKKEKSINEVLNSTKTGALAGIKPGAVTGTVFSAMSSAAYILRSPVPIPFSIPAMIVCMGIGAAFGAAQGCLAGGLGGGLASSINDSKANIPLKVIAPCAAVLFFRGTGLPAAVGAYCGTRAIQKMEEDILRLDNVNSI